MALQRIVIRGGGELHGEIPISGAKNAALPLVAAGLLTPGTLILDNLPELADVGFMLGLVEQHGAALARGPRHVEITAERITNTTAPYDLVRKMRASVLVLGPLVARMGEAKVSLPGGCAIGTRPVDLHLKGLEAMGARIELADGYVHATAPKGLKGTTIRFPFVSVGATENLLMAATLAEGETVLDNAAREPEITDLARCLEAMGADIAGIGTERLIVRGQPALHGARYSILPDRIETGTYAMAVGVAGGRVELVGARPDTLEDVIDVLNRCGVEVTPTERGMAVKRNGHRVAGVDVMTQPYPGFPTDLQAQMMVLMATADGAAMITETIFENRFMHVPELARMGANVTVHGASALVRGVPRLKGAPVMATDLRASISLVLAGLAAEGETVVNRIYHLDRGYERVEEKLGAVGARIQRVPE
ncbi:UDP-N-acetylglucosamine 1-carboxyvinyltransferase [Zavarzinia compransoris]|uniref:UDP-N-acetylglucosamine 1-carboxyvinyltransferase n=1 Tax=Zavarzinia compransoris TaxID=1264899 RepID=A0A317DW98_9PROT|nr:UDP-N-acetylglucosamine 1-carboxyvinyltransferase [Zavarzinia compransoris]PWR18682.1 UDP-N-acetylglucosamine 1-carboxyvinyltransferase [Zavarzinia compransoris]TDP48656.1 UDP-N-acetylglucosamine 1-carboxyvinyltransferase [Zavarzinia compransoris]